MKIFEGNFNRVKRVNYSLMQLSGVDRYCSADTLTHFFKAGKEQVVFQSPRIHEPTVLSGAVA